MTDKVVLLPEWLQPPTLAGLSYSYYNDYAAVAALAGASFDNVANMTRPDPCAA